VSTDPVKYLSRIDPLLNKVIEAVGKYSIKFRHDPFQSLLESIIYQQLAGAVASLSTPDAILKIKVGLSSKKIEYLKDLYGLQIID